MQIVSEVDDVSVLFSLFIFCHTNIGYLAGSFMLIGVQSIMVTVLLEGERNDVNLCQPFVMRSGVELL